MSRTVICDYCGSPAAYVDSSIVYRKSYGMIYYCEKDAAWVGVHKGTDKPLGRLANKELRAAKIAAHAAFDPLWRGVMRRDRICKQQARSKAYKWLSEALDVNPGLCHIGMFDLEQCKRVVELVRSL